MFKLHYIAITFLATVSYFRANGNKRHAFNADLINKIKIYYTTLPVAWKAFFFLSKYSDFWLQIVLVFSTLISYQ